MGRVEPEARQVQLGADHGEAAEEAPQKGQKGSTRKVVTLLARVFFPMFYVNVQQAREHERKGPHLKPAGRSLSSELRPFLQRFFSGGRCPSQQRLVSNSLQWRVRIPPGPQRCTALFSSSVLVYFSTVQATFFSFRVV